MTLYQLDPKPAITAALDAGRDTGYIERRVAAWLSGRGYVLGSLAGSGVVVNGSGHVTVDTDRDPAAEWAAFDPEAPTAAEQDDAAEQEQARQIIAALRAGTATNRQVQRAVAWLIRREVGL